MPSSAGTAEMRRRSSNHSPTRPPSPTVLYSPNSFRDISFPRDTFCASQPTILLVPSGSASPPLPVLPSFSPGHGAGIPITTSDTHTNCGVHVADGDDGASASMPRSTSYAHLEVKQESDTRGADVRIPRLPPPDYDVDWRQDASVAIQLDPCALVHHTLAHPPHSSTPLRAPPPCLRSDSESSRASRLSTSSVSSYTSSSSAATGRVSLALSVRTTSRFTHKWPEPRSLRNPTRSGRPISLSGVADAVDDGRGLGMNGVRRWTTHKIVLLFSVCSVFIYGICGLYFCIQAWFRTWPGANVLLVADSDIVVLITLAASILVLTSLVGLTGLILNSRPILAIYALLLWPAFVSIAAIGYTSYKRYAFALDHKLSYAWSEYFTPLGRLLVQESLGCCGFYNSIHEAVASPTCYLRTQLPGCKGKLFEWERRNLADMWSISLLGIIPMHILNMVVALLCANHVTKTFGKGIMPVQYRLKSADIMTDAQSIEKSTAPGPLVIRPEPSRNGLAVH